jgi:hypothetical protein
LLESIGRVDAELLVGLLDSRAPRLVVKVLGVLAAWECQAARERCVHI